MASESEELASDYKARMNSVVLIRDFVNEDPQIVYKGNVDDPSDEKLEDFTHWINGNAYPKLIPFIADNKEMMFDRKRKGFKNHVMFVLEPTNGLVSYQCICIYQIVSFGYLCSNYFNIHCYYYLHLPLQCAGKFLQTLPPI